jgi:hypothetical protein
MEVEKSIMSLGGPLVLIEAPLYSEWRGTGGSSSPKSTAKTDYERACGVREYAGVIPVSNGEAMVLGDMPMLTSFFLRDNGTIVIYRYVYAPEDFDYLRIPHILMDNQLNILETCSFITHGKELRLFDATADMTRDRPEVLLIPLKKGRYSVDTLHFLSDETSIIFHDFKHEGNEKSA